MNEVILSSSFDRQLRKLIKNSPSLKKKASKVLKILVEDVHQPSLRLHKLSGESNWAISVTDDIRMIIQFENERVFCLRIGTHDEVY